MPVGLHSPGLGMAVTGQKCARNSVSERLNPCVLGARQLGKGEDGDARCTGAKGWGSATTPLGSVLTS